jgi:hypothetical protein
LTAPHQSTLEGVSIALRKYRPNQNQARPIEIAIRRPRTRCWVASFARASREDDYRIAWGFFAGREYSHCEDLSGDAGMH